MNQDLINIIICACSLIIEISIIRYYLARRSLPLKNTVLFLKMIRTVFIVTVCNFITILMAFLKPSAQAVYLHGLCNVLYYALYETSFIYIAGYILWKCVKKNLQPYIKYIDVVAVITFATSLVMVSVYRNYMFEINGDNLFQTGIYYHIVNVLPFVLVMVSLVIFLIRRYRTIDSRDKGIVYGCCILMTGFILEYLSRNIIAMDFFFCFAMMILYISTENPDFYTSDNMKVHNSKGFIKIVDEYIYEKKDMYICGIYIENFDGLRNRYGITNLYAGLNAMAQWMHEEFEEQYVFLLGDRCFIIVSLEPVDFINEKNKIYQRFKKPFIEKDMEVFLWPRFFYFKDHIFSGYTASEIVSASSYAIDASPVDDTKICIDETIFRQVENEKKVQDILQECIDMKNVDIYIQPIFSTRSKKIECGEVLVRINHSEYGLMTPSMFIGIAEKSTKIMQLGFIIFEKTCQYISEHDFKSLGIEFFNINISPIQFQYRNLVNDFKDIADKYDVDFSIFNFEITESFIKDENIIKRHVEKFNDYNAITSLDDFGKGGSNLSRLTEYPFNMAKLDISLVWKYFDGETKIMKDVIRIFKSENLKIVAEGVETREMVEELTDLGCEYLQGYYFAKPIPSENFIEYVKDYNSQSDLRV